MKRTAERGDKEGQSEMDEKNQKVEGMKKEGEVLPNVSFLRVYGHNTSPWS